MENRIMRLFHFLTLASLFLFAGCASFPNKPYGGNHHPSSLEQLSQKNLLLVKELGKLPEIQDGISLSEENALIRIATFYASNSSEFDIAFKKIYNVGLADVRKYCTPLQALFWLSEEDLLKSKDYLINDFSLENFISVRLRIK